MNAALAIGWTIGICVALWWWCRHWETSADAFRLACELEEARKRQ